MTLSSRNSVSECRSRVVDDAVSSRMGWSSGLVLTMVGGSTPSGSTTLLSLDCTSVSAASMLRSMSNSSVIEACPCWICDVTLRTPCVDSTCSSILSTTSLSMISGAAPLHVVLMVSTGKSTSGCSLTPRRESPIAPKMISAAMSIQAKTGRRMERSASDAMAEPRRWMIARCVSERSMVNYFLARSAPDWGSRHSGNAS